MLVVVSGVPRAGTSWLLRLLADLWPVERIPGLPPGVEDRPVADPGALARPWLDGRPRLAKWSWLVFGPAEAGRMVSFFVHRDPYDLLLSQLHFARHGPAGLGGLDREAAWALLLAHSVPRIVATYSAYAAAPPGVDVGVAYEELHRDAPAVLERLASRIGADPARVAEVCARHHFAVESGRAAGVEDVTRYHRKGVVGDGLLALSEAEQAALHAVAPGLDALVRRVRERRSE